MIYKYSSLLVSIVFLFILGGCASQGQIVEDDYEEIAYTSADRPLVYEYNPQFIIAGDSQSGKRIVEKFLRRENWVTWKQAIFPFYQLYLFGNGFIGAYNHFTHKPDYGKADRKIINEHLVNHLDTNETDFYLLLGDIVGTDGRYPSHWKLFFDSFGGEKGILGKVPIYPIIGNHEYANDDSKGYYNYNTVFNTPRFYTIESPDLAIIVLDSNYLLDQAGLIDDDLQDELFSEWFVGTSNEPSWLEKELESHTQKIKIIAMHHSPMMLGWHFKDWYKVENGLDLLSKRKALVEVFKKYNVQIVLSGHEHYYQHNILDYNNGKDQIHFIVTSSAGVPIRSKPDEKVLDEKIAKLKLEGYNVSSVVQEDVYHFSRIHFDKDALIFNTYQIETGKPDRIFDTLRLNLSE